MAYLAAGDAERARRAAAEELRARAALGDAERAGHRRAASSAWRRATRGGSSARRRRSRRRRAGSSARRRCSRSAPPAAARTGAPRRASRCGGRSTSPRAAAPGRSRARPRTELAACGARPRRALLTGRDSLTASERRVAELVAQGLSNPDVARALVVSRSTVESHLQGHLPQARRPLARGARGGAGRKFTEGRGCEPPRRRRRVAGMTAHRPRHHAPRRPSPPPEHPTLCAAFQADGRRVPRSRRAAHSRRRRARHLGRLRRAGARDGRAARRARRRPGRHRRAAADHAPRGGVGRRSPRCTSAPRVCRSTSRAPRPRMRTSSMTPTRACSSPSARSPATCPGCGARARSSST